MASIVMAKLASVSWAKVIAQAPAVLDMAERVWSSIRKKEAESKRLLNQKMSSHEGRISSHEDSLRALDVRSNTLESEVASLSDVTKSLAEQSSRLIAEVEILRRRVLALLVVSVILVLGLIGAYIWLSLRHAA